MSQKIRDTFGGVVPDTVEALTTLPGVGRKTANLIVGDVYGKPAVVADTHFIRMSNRLGFVDTKDPYKVELAMRKLLPPEESNDFCHRCVYMAAPAARRARRCAKGAVWQNFAPKKALPKSFRLQGSIFSIWRYSPVQGLCRLFLFIGFFLLCLRVSRQMNFSHKVKDNIYFLKTLAVYLLRRMDNDFLHKFIDDSRR